MIKTYNFREPYVVILVGPPLSGKTTWVNKYFSNKNVKIISRDDIITRLYGTDYNKAFKMANQREVDKILNKELYDASKRKDNVIIDMTHMTKKRRKSNLSYFGDEYFKVCVVFPILPEREYKKRNNKRFKEENKFINIDVVKNMISHYEPINNDENFDRIIFLD